MITKIIPNPNVDSSMKLDQNEQYISNFYSFVTKLTPETVSIAHPYVKCRDFLNDVLIFSTYIKKDIERIYGFSLEINKNPIDWGNPQFLIKYGKTEELDLFIKNLHYLHQLEDFYEISKTSVERTNFKKTILISFSSFWVSNTLSLSFYTYILRCLSYPLEGNLWEFINNYKITKTDWQRNPCLTLNPEGRLIEDISPNDLSFFILFLPQIVEQNHNYDYLHYYINNDNKYSIHDQAGFVSFLLHHYKTIFNNIYNKNNKICPADVEVVT